MLFVPTGCLETTGAATGGTTGGGLCIPLLTNQDPRPAGSPCRRAACRQPVGRTAGSKHRYA